MTMTEKEKETLEAIKIMGIGRTNDPEAEKQLILKALSFMEQNQKEPCKGCKHPNCPKCGTTHRLSECIWCDN